MLRAINLIGIGKQMKVDPDYLASIDAESPWSIDLSEVQIVYKFAGWLSTSLDLKVTVF